MSWYKKIASTAIVSLLFAAVPAFAADKTAKAPETAAAKPTDVVVKVNGTTITRKELDREVKYMLARNRVPQPAPPELQKRAEEAALDQLVAQELIYQKAEKVPVKDLDSQLKTQMDKIKSQFKTEAEMNQRLQDMDMTFADLKEVNRKGIVVSSFLEGQFSSKIKVTDEEAKKFYDANLDKYFKKGETVKASHILIGADQNASADDKKKAKEKAEAILKRVKAGEDFATLARAESSCPSSAQGGDLGTFGKGQMVKPFEEAAFALKTGEVSGVVETQFGYHIIKLTEKNPASTEPFEKVKTVIVDNLKREKAAKALQEYVQDLKKTAKIEKM
ncbi:peptidylprolyl isomerase [Geomesophilobacter sediminis]|uniref:peptidylprolyl isomerase n=1 Tax=Geomesophilobacter sediminis TaxID=2798584 RepID=A0A8J7JD12_9BACT|nr:peptidylprolyl isomerase [Geomesophilobacter sediminis]MBJ6723249.1 peptidylprolyl isomerase [Geomesophilobacter sediminis]